MAIEQSKTKKTTRKTPVAKTAKTATKAAKKTTRRKGAKAEGEADTTASAVSAETTVAEAPAAKTARTRKTAAPKAEAVAKKATRAPATKKAAAKSAAAEPVWADDAPAAAEAPRKAPAKAEAPVPVAEPARREAPAGRPAAKGGAEIADDAPGAAVDGERRGRRRGRRGRGRGRGGDGAARPAEQPAKAAATAPAPAAGKTSNNGAKTAEPRDAEDRGSRRRRRRGRGRGRGEAPVGGKPAGRLAELDDSEVYEDEYDTEVPMEPTWSAADDSYDEDDVDVLDEVTDLAPEEDWEEPDEGEDEAPRAATGTREMLINVSAGDEVRIAVLENRKLEELFIERAGTQSQVGNIYKGKVTNVESSIQAVFIDFGGPKNGFLHISDVQPQYFGKRGMPAEDVGRKIPRHSRPPIQDCFKRGQEVIVQITKDGLGTKGPTLSTYLSIPGRFIVMMPGMNKLGVSRKIDDDDARRKMRDILNQLDLPSGFGFILRTAGIGRTRRELQRDLNYLVRLWRTVAERVKREPAPAELYRESDLVSRTIRDIYTHEFRRLITDDALTAEKARLFLQIVMPKVASPVELYTDREPLFHRYGIEAEIEKINMRHVPLPSGGSIVIDQTEAMVAIDVNSGKFRTPDDPETTALKINLEAADEIARQLRLRDLGGLIVCDFIDMRYDRNRRAVENALRDALMLHKERVRVLRMSAFGLIEITRQRRGPSIKRNSYLDCQHCKGTGLIKMPESVVLDVMRIIQLATHRSDVQRVAVSVANDVAFQILNSKRAVLAEVEKETGKQVLVRGEPGFTPDEVSFRCEDAQGRLVKFTAGVAAGPEPRRR